MLKNRDVNFTHAAAADVWPRFVDPRTFQAGYLPAPQRQAEQGDGRGRILNMSTCTYMATTIIISIALSVICTICRIAFCFVVCLLCMAKPNVNIYQECELTKNEIKAKTKA